MRTLYIILTSLVLFCNLVSLIVVLIDYFKKPKRPIVPYTDINEMYPTLLTPKGRKAIRKMKKYIKKDRITKFHIHSIYGISEIEKGNKK